MDIVFDKGFVDLLTSVSCKQLIGNTDDWRTVLKKVDLCDITYEPAEIQYQGQYFIEKDEYYQDYSFIFYLGSQPVAVCPLCVYQRNGEFMLGSNGSLCVFPLIVDELWGKNTHKKVGEAYFKILKYLCDKYKIDQFSYIVNSFIYKLDMIYTTLVRNQAFVQYLRHDLYVNLRLSFEKIFSNIRKSNKNLINSSKKHLDYEIVNAASQNISETFDAFRRLHIEVAGRETRSEQTWRIQEESLKCSDDFIVLVKDKEAKLVGASLFSANAQTFRYSVAAFNRDLFDKYALGHVSQMIAIENMVGLNKRWYYVGSMPLEFDNPTPTSKEISIGDFKKGFATDLTITNKLIVTSNVLNNILS